MTEPKDSRTLTRYRAGGYGSMVESEHGEWVRYDDAMEALVAAGYGWPLIERRKTQLADWTGLDRRTRGN